MNQGKAKTKPFERRQALMNLLQTGNVYSRSDLIEMLHSSSATLSEDIKFLCAQGIPIKKAGNRSGSIYLDIAEATPDYYLPITSAGIRKWNILYLLQISHAPLSQLALSLKLLNQYIPDFDKYIWDTSSIQSQEELKNISSETMEKAFSQYTLFTDLQKMEQDGLIIKNKTLKLISASDPKSADSVIPQNTYSLAAKAPRIIEADPTTIEEYCYFFATEGTSLPISSTLSDIYVKASLLCPDFNKNKSLYSENHIIRGKRFQFHPTVSQKLQQFSRFHYQDYLLTIPYTDMLGQHMILQSFAVGILVYNEELNHFYVLGKNAAQERIILRLMNIELDGIIEETKHPNKFYNCQEFIDIYHEMFFLSVSEASNVFIRFQNIPSVRRKVENLKNFRSNNGQNIHVRCYFSDDKKEILYHDRIRGLEDFARYLRAFGSSVIVMEPPELKQRMQDTAYRVMDIYERMHNYAKTDHSF